MPSYTVYGLRLESNHRINGLPSARPGSAPPDVRVHFGSLPQYLGEGTPATDWYEGAERDAAGEPQYRIRRLANGELWLQYSDGTQFLVGASAETVHAVWPGEFTIDDAIVYLLGPVLGIVLRARRRPCLHASVVEAHGRALAFLGPGGAGKSTIAAAFVGAGRSVLSDDLLVLTECDDRFWAEPGYSWLRLWPASVEGLYGSPDALPLIVTGWEKRYTDLVTQGAFCHESLRVGALYLIGDPLGAADSPAIAPIAHREALLGLIANSYSGHLPGPSARRDEFEVLSRLASAVPVRRVGGINDWASLAHLPAVVLQDFAEVARVAAR